MSSILGILGLETATLTATVTALPPAENGNAIGKGGANPDEAGPDHQPPPEPPRAAVLPLALLLTLIPPVAVGVVWWIGRYMYDLAIPCTVRGSFGGCTRTLAAFANDISGLNFPRGAALAAYDVAGRFAWQSTLVLFLAVAVLVSVIGAYLTYRALKESGIRGAEGVLLVIVPLGVAVFAQAALTPHDNVLLNDVLLPVVGAASEQEPYLTRLIGWTQAVFRGAAFVASSIVVLAASVSLLRNAAGGPVGDKEHLVNQWRRLKHALFAGAALLVSAILFQTAFYGWAHSLAQAVTAEVEQDQRAVLARAAAERAALEPLRIDHAAAQTGLNDEIRRHDAGMADTTSAAGRQRLVTLRTAATAAAALYRPDSARVDSLLGAAHADTARIRIRAAPFAAVAARVDQLTTAGVAQAGGMVNSILLLVMYLPGALILLERARDLSITHAVGPDGKPATTEKQREQWRADNGIGFSFWSQWPKALAVLAPALSSIPAAKLILDLFKP